MKHHVRMSVGFARYPNARLNGFAILVLLCLKDNPLFPNLPVSLAALSALVRAFQDALAAAQGGLSARAALREARASLISALRQLVAQVQSQGLTKESDALSSGFDIVVWDNSQKALTVPVLTGLDNSVPGPLQLWLRAVRNAKVYQVEFRVGDEPWQDGGIFPNTQNIIFPNLQAGTFYSARVRAVGGSEKVSGWSATLTAICL